jgi:hypothetical protein
MFRNRRNLRCRHEKKDGVWIDETAYEPGTRNSIDFWSLSRDPDGSLL